MIITYSYTTICIQAKMAFYSIIEERKLHHPRANCFDVQLQGSPICEDLRLWPQADEIALISASYVKVDSHSGSYCWNIHL